MIAPDHRPAVQGFSLIELLIAMTLMLVVLSGVFAVMSPALAASLADPERVDLHQRLRVAAETLTRELRSAGDGMLQGSRPGPLADAFAPVLPFRRGRRSPDPPGTVRRDTLTMLRVVPGGAQTVLAAGFVAQSGTVMIGLGPGCPPGDPSCGFRSGTDVVIYDGSGAYDTFSITAVSGNLLTLQHNMIDGTVYAAGAAISEVESSTFALKLDPVTGASQIIAYNGGAGSDAPMIDHVVALDFTVVGSADPPQALAPPTDPLGPWTTYGPAAPPVGVTTSGYPPGENCLFSRDAAGNLVPRLPSLGTPGSQVPLAPSMLADGPWCPDAVNPNRYDADLLRVREIEVTVRVEASASAVRASASGWFARSGTSIDARRFVADREARLIITPRALRPGR